MPKRHVTRPKQGLSSLAPGGGKRRDPGNEVEGDVQIPRDRWQNCHQDFLPFGSLQKMFAHEVRQGEMALYFLTIQDIALTMFFCL